MLIAHLFESITPKLFHATTVIGLYEMLEDDEIKPNTGHPITHTGGERRSAHWALRPRDINRNGYLEGVSLTRNSIFARAWKSDGIVLVLNADLIKRDFRVRPISFFGGRREVADEAEEFVVGAIKPLSRYLICIETTEKTIAANPLLAEISTLFPFHPQLTINGHAWRKIGLDKGTIIKAARSNPSTLVTSENQNTAESDGN